MWPRCGCSRSTRLSTGPSSRFRFWLRQNLGGGRDASAWSVVRDQRQPSFAHYRPSAPSACAPAFRAPVGTPRHDRAGRSFPESGDRFARNPIGRPNRSRVGGVGPQGERPFIHIAGGGNQSGGDCRENSDRCDSHAPRPRPECPAHPVRGPTRGQECSQILAEPKRNGVRGPAANPLSRSCTAPAPRRVPTGW